MSEAEQKVKAMTASEINEVCFEFGVPVQERCEDGEGWYWKFQESALPVADDLGELLKTGIEMLAAQRIEVSNASN